MSRSAKDATRFTATRPHAYSKPPNTPRPTQTPPESSPATPGPVETPQEKVARLRAQHDAKRAAEITSWDRIVVRGRIIADAAHRFTAVGLVGLTIIAGGVTLFSFADMATHNRRKMREYYAEQNIIRQGKLVEARAALAAGQADDDQILILNQEMAREQVEKQKEEKKNNTLLKRAGRLLFGDGIKREEEVEAEVLNVDGESASPEVKEQAATLVDKFEKARIPEGSEILRAVDEKRREGEKELLRRGAEGGPLDKLAEQNAAVAEGKSKSRGSWFSRS